MRATVELSLITDEAVAVTGDPPDGVNVTLTLLAETVPEGKGLASKLILVTPGCPAAGANADRVTLLALAVACNPNVSERTKRKKTDNR